jgi:hypothetical protein
VALVHRLSHLGEARSEVQARMGASVKDWIYFTYFVANIIVYAFSMMMYFVTGNKRWAYPAIVVALSCLAILVL